MKKLFLVGLVIIQCGRAQSLPAGSTEQPITNWEYRMVGESAWKPAKVPGTIISNLVNLEDISDPQHPYYGDNEKLYQWVADKDWEFRTILPIDTHLVNAGYTYDIEFGSLDLFAVICQDSNVYLHENAFYPFTIYQATARKTKELRITIYSTKTKAKQLYTSDPIQLPGEERVYARTPQYQFGWDWGPAFINMGIRQPVKLIITPPKKVSITEMWVDEELLHQKDEMIKVYVAGITDYYALGWHIKAYLDGDSIGGYDLSARPGYINGYIYEIKKPKLWWPNGANRQSHYYEFDLRLTVPDDTITLAHQHIYYACTNIQLVQEKDKDGESFYFTVNGEKVFAKGANYVPDDSFDPGKNSAALVNLAADANMNMIRVWGGGTYPDDAFYITCMKRGIMIWQDFMFACAMYPGSRSFLDQVALEASTQVERLGNYNHIALWCGNNEVEEGWKNWGWQNQLHIHGNDSATVWAHYDILFHHIFPETIGTANQLYNTHIHYISTSPKFGWGRKESMTDGDAHYWGVWWGLEPIEKMTEKVPRFMSEFGMQAMPDLRTLRKVVPDSVMNFGSSPFKNHQKHPTGFQTLDHYLKEYFAVPPDIPTYAYATQVLQAYTLTTAIEAQRRAMPYCMGSLIWQLNDCWPVTSWSLVDYELRPKIAYEEVTKAFEPVIISVQETKTSYDIYIVNDDSQELDADLHIRISDFYGKEMWQKTVHTKVKKQCSNMYLSVAKKELAHLDLSTVYLHAYLIESATTHQQYLHTYASSDYHFVRPNQLRLPKPDFTCTLGENNALEISSRVYCPYTYIPGYGEGKSIYLGHVPPGATYTLYTDQLPLEYFYILQKNPGLVQCLNQLLFL